MSAMDIRCEAGFINSIVDVVVDPVICFINLALKVLREEIQVLVWCLQQIVKFCVQHSYDFAALIIDNAVGLLVV